MGLLETMKDANREVEHPEWRVGDAITYRDPDTGVDEEGTFGGMRSQWLGGDIVLFDTGVPGANGRWNPDDDPSTGCWVPESRVRRAGTEYVKPFRW